MTMSKIITTVKKINAVLRHCVHETLYDPLFIVLISGIALAVFAFKTTVLAVIFSALLGFGLSLILTYAYNKLTKKDQTWPR